MIWINRILRIACLLLIPIGLPIHTPTHAQQDPSRVGTADPLPASRLQKHNTEFFISVDSVLMKLKQKREIVLVDVRERGDFEKFRIPGSINLPLFALKTKTFLKSQPFVLINEGHAYGQLERACERLRSAGFSQASIMYGGIAAWHQKGGQLEGDVFSFKELNRMSARDFFEERDYANWLVLDVSEEANPNSGTLIARSVSIPYRSNNKFLADLNKIQRQHAGDPLQSVLIYNDNGNYSEEMEKLIRESKIRNVFYLKGGLDGYKEFLQRRALLLETKESRKVVKKCVNCP